MANCFTILTIMVAVLTTVKAQCWEGDYITASCINVDGYDTYQWAIYVSENCIEALSEAMGEAWICLGGNYCYLECELVESEISPYTGGVVSGICQCLGSGPLVGTSLPATCFTPSGNDCSWYANCLEERYNCQGTPDDYAIQYAEKFCFLYEDNYDKFTPQGQKWVNAVRKCLQASLVAYLYPWRTATCSQIKTYAFSQHINCYLNPGQFAPFGLCTLNPHDFLVIMATIKSAFRQAFLMTFIQAIETFAGCYAYLSLDGLIPMDVIVGIELARWIDYIIENNNAYMTHVAKPKAIYTSIGASSPMGNTTGAKNKGDALRNSVMNGKSLYQATDDSRPGSFNESILHQVAAAVIDKMSQQLNWDGASLVYVAYSASNNTGNDNEFTIRLLLLDASIYNLNSTSTSSTSFAKTIDSFKESVKKGVSITGPSKVSVKSLATCENLFCNTTASVVTPTSMAVKNVAIHAVMILVVTASLFI